MIRLLWAYHSSSPEPLFCNVILSFSLLKRQGAKIEAWGSYI